MKRKSRMLCVSTKKFYVDNVEKKYIAHIHVTCVWWSLEKVCERFLLLLLLIFCLENDKKMCFSCKGLRRCEVYEQNSEASI